MTDSNAPQLMIKKFDEIMLKISENHKNNRSYEKDLDELSEFLGEQKILKVFEIVENNRIAKFRSTKTGRELFQVNGTADHNGCQSINLLFPRLPFCTCFSFNRQVIRREILYCKHYVALRLAMCFDKLETREIEHAEFDAKIKLIKI